ncbi:hypothetical protein [Aquipuribacter sp. SD81]|uniref:hypothetical protein n=1 Tax=Aquipuribacter sp. SD81 TaxID=3127703 RepID=UPI0030187678
MSTTEEHLDALAARNPVRDADVRDTTGGRRRALARVWTDADDAPPSGVLARRATPPPRPRRASTLLVAAAVALLVTGTAAVVSGVTDPLLGRVAADGAPAGPTTDPLLGADLSGISEAQAAEIDDRVATEAENRAAYERYRQCLAAEGFDVPEDPILQSDGTFMGGVPDAAVRSGVDAECYDREWALTDTLFQTRPEFQDAPSRTRWMRECLEERGIAPRDTADGLAEQLREAGIRPADCFY